MNCRAMILGGILAAGANLTIVSGASADPPLSAHELVQAEPDAGQKISNAIAADQRNRAENEKQDALDSERQNARERNDDGRYYWWWPFRR